MRTPEQERQEKIFKKIGGSSKNQTTQELYDVWILTPEYKNHIDNCINEVNKIKTKSK